MSSWITIIMDNNYGTKQCQLCRIGKDTNPYHAGLILNI